MMLVCISCLTVPFQFAFAEDMDEDPELVSIWKVFDLLIDLIFIMVGHRLSLPHIGDRLDTTCLASPDGECYN